MKNPNPIVTVFFICLISISFGQSRFTIEHFEVTTNFYAPNINYNNLFMFSTPERKFISNYEKNGNQTSVSQYDNLNTNGVDLMVGLKRNNQSISSRWDVLFGLGYKTAKRNMIEYYENRPKSSIDFDNIWLNILGGSSTTSRRISLYYIKSDVVSFQTQVNFWFINQSRFNFGLAPKLELGLEFNSKLVKEDYIESNTTRFLSNSSNTSHINTTHLKTNNGLLFSSSFPFLFTCGLAKKDDNTGYYLQLFTLIGFEIQKNIGVDSGVANNTKFGFGMRYTL